MSLELVRIVNKPIPSNCFLIFDKEIGNNCLIVDPGSECSDDLEFELKRLDLIPEYIILTHEHFDHVWGCNELIEQYGAKIIASACCSEGIQSNKKNHSLFYNQVGFEIAPADVLVEDIGFRFEWNGIGLDFFIAEGHTNGGICFVVGEYLFTGDSLIKDLKTVTKLYCGSKEKLKETIRKIEELRGRDLTVCPGHEPCFLLDDYDLNKAIVK